MVILEKRSRPVVVLPHIRAAGFFKAIAELFITVGTVSAHQCVKVVLGWQPPLCTWDSLDAIPAIALLHCGAQSQTVVADIGRSESQSLPVGYIDNHGGALGVAMGVLTIFMDMSVAADQLALVSGSGLCGHPVRLRCGALHPVLARIANGDGGAHTDGAAGCDAPAFFRVVGKEDVVLRVVVILGTDGLVVVAHAEKSPHLGLFLDGTTAADGVAREVLASLCRCVVEREAHLVAVARIEIRAILHALFVADDVGHGILEALAVEDEGSNVCACLDGARHLGIVGDGCPEVFLTLSRGGRLVVNVFQRNFRCSGSRGIVADRVEVVMTRGAFAADVNGAVEHAVAHIDFHVVAPADESAGVLCGTGCFLRQCAIEHAARHHDTAGQGAAAAAMADKSTIVGMPDNPGRHAHITNSHDASSLTDETGCVVGAISHGGRHGAYHMQVQEGCVTHSAERCGKSRGRFDNDGQGMAVAVERADEGMRFRAHDPR